MNALDYLTLTQAAEMLGYRDGSYLRRLCIDGRIVGAVKVGKTWLIPKTWAEEAQKQGESGQGARGKQRI